MKKGAMVRNVGALLLLGLVTLFAFPEIRKPLFAAVAGFFGGGSQAAADSGAGGGE